MTTMEDQIAQWRSFILKRRAVDAPDAEELEDHLRSQAADLIATGLSPEEAFLVAVKRIGSQDELSREFARVHSGRLWKQLVLTGDEPGGSTKATHRELWVVAAFAVAAALAVKAPNFFGLTLADDSGFYLRNVSLLVLPMLTAYFVWKRGVGVGALTGRTIAIIAAAFATRCRHRQRLSVRGRRCDGVPHRTPPSDRAVARDGHRLHGGEWRSDERRMDFIRFTGEWFIYMSLIALGGGVLTALTVGTFNLLDVDAAAFSENWLLPCGAAGATVIAAWLVEAKRGVIENMAPVLARVFMPLFTLLLLALLGTTLLRLTDVSLDRDALIVVDALLVFVLGLVVYAVSARAGSERVLLIDRVQFTLVITAWALDGLVLAAMLARIFEWGFTPNRAAALGLNIIILANLSWTSWVGHVMLHNNCPFARLERFQTHYLPVYLMWASGVVVLFPLVFGFA